MNAPGIPRRLIVLALAASCLATLTTVGGCTAGTNGRPAPSERPEAVSADLLPQHLGGSIDQRLNRVRGYAGFDQSLVYPLGRARWRSPRDVQPLVQAAIDRLPEAGGTVQLPDGVLTISSPIRIERSGVHLRGAGAGETIIRFEPGAMQGRILDCVELRGPSIDEPIRYVMVSDLSIDATYWEQPGSYNPRGLDADHAADVLVENVDITNAFVGLTFGLGVSNATANNVTVTNWHNNAFNASGDKRTGGARDILFYYCTARNSLNERRGGSPGNRKNAWEIEDGAADVALVRCVVENASGNGFAVRNHSFDEAATTGPVTFLNCVARNVDGEGFFVIGNRYPNNVADVTLVGCETDSVATFTKGVRGLTIRDSAFGASVSIGPARTTLVERSSMRTLTLWSFPVEVQPGGEIDSEEAREASYETRIVLRDVAIANQLSLFGEVNNVELVRTPLPRSTNVQPSE